MTTDYSDPNDDEELLDDEPSPQLEKPFELEEDQTENETDPTVAHDSDAIVAATGDQSSFDAVAAAIDVDQFWRDSIRKGNEAIQSVGDRSPAFPDPSGVPGSPEVLGPMPLPLPLAPPGGKGPRKLPDLETHAGPPVEQLTTTRQSSPEQSLEIPPVTVHQSPPQIVGSEKVATKEKRERLHIEVEVTLANAERISRIAVEEAKAEFKRLASQATQRLDEKFYEYRVSQRLLRRG